MSTATAAFTESKVAADVGSMRRSLKARTRKFKSGSLYNVLPLALKNDISYGCENCKLFEGDIFVEEYLNINEAGNVDQVPSYQLKFGWDRSPDKRFCETEVIDNIHKLNEVVKNWANCFRIMMQCSMNRYILLELKFSDSIEDRRFRDLIFRIREEFEILAELMWD